MCRSACGRAGRFGRNCSRIRRPRTAMPWAVAAGHSSPTASRHPGRNLFRRDRKLFMRSVFQTRIRAPPSLDSAHVGPQNRFGHGEMPASQQ